MTINDVTRQDFIKFENLREKVGDFGMANPYEVAFITGLSAPIVLAIMANYKALQDREDLRNY